MARLQDQEAHLLTLDITVPDRSGLEVLSQIKQRWPDTEVLVLTALEETATAVEAMTLGAYGYLLKPIESGELVLQARKPWSVATCSSNGGSTRPRSRPKSASRCRPFATRTKKRSSACSAPRAIATRRRGHINDRAVLRTVRGIPRLACRAGAEHPPGRRCTTWENRHPRRHPAEARPLTAEEFAV